MKLRALIIPKSRPEATMAGMMGTKISPRTLMARIKMYSGERSILNGTVKILSQIDRGGLGPALL